MNLGGVRALPQSAYLAEVWKTRYFWLSMVHMDLRTRYRGSALGIGWSLLRPLAMTAVFCVVFTKLFDVSLADYAPLLLTGLAVWQFLTEAITLGCLCFNQGSAYIRQRCLPLGIFPLRTVLGAGFHFLISLGLAILLSIILLGGPNAWALLHLIPCCVLLLVFAWSAATMAGVAYTHFPDTKHLLEIALQIFFYLTPIMYPPEMLRAAKSCAWLVAINPFAYYVEMMREPILFGRIPSLGLYGVVTGITAAAFAMAVVCLWRNERRLIFWL